jgi:4-hydroxy-tetrahydrodipicolinate reductase
MIKVAVVGSAGRMGAEVCAAVGATQDLSLVATVDLDDSLDTVASADVVVDFATPDTALDRLHHYMNAGVHAVIGTTGFTDERLAEVRQMFSKSPGIGVMIVPNFSIGAVLMMRFAKQAAPYFESVEVIEMHHPEKLDAPSGTARLTADLITEARREAGVAAGNDATVAHDMAARGSKIGDVSVHSVRLRGLTAHQEVLLGNVGELLSIRHDSLDRASFMPGVLLAIREVAERPGLTIGLDPLLPL